jgi:amino acid transporter
VRSGFFTPFVDKKMYEDNAENPEEPLLAEDVATPLPKEGKRGVNALQLTMMIYFFTSGGPFGIESAIGAGGILLSLIGIILIPLLWSLPQALMSAELALMMSENGGNVVWVQRAFGDFIGWINAFNCLVQSFSSMSLLVVLFVEYLPYDFSPLESWAIKISFVLFVTILNILGLRWVSRLSVLFIVFILSPFFAEGILLGVRGGFKGMSTKEYFNIPPINEVQWNLLLSTTIWSYGGFDSMGSLAGEVKGGRKTFITGIIGAMPLIMVNYIYPTIIGFQIARKWQDWQSGYFTDVAFMLSDWLGKWMVAASALSNFGQYNAAMGPLARVIWAMARGEGSAQKLPKFLGWSWQRHTGTIRPIAAIIATGILSAALAAIPFNLLVQMFLIVRIVNLSCEYAALIRLKYSEPDTPRPFVVPGGKVGAWLLGGPTLILAAVTLAYTSWEVWVFGLATNAVIIISYFVKVLLYNCWNNRKNNGAVN